MKHEIFTALVDGMLTAEGFLRFALWLAQCDLHTLRPGDWVNLREDFETFLGGSSSLAVTSGVCILPAVEEAPFPKDFLAEDFERLQGALLNILIRETSSCPPGGRQILDTKMLSVFRHGWRQDMPGVRQIVAHGTTD